MRIKTMLTSAVCLAVCSGGAFAQEKDKTPGSGPNPYSDCGIGAALFPNSDVWASISNVIWDIGTTAVTSATMSPETCEGQDAQAATFILETYDQLVEETALGEGDHFTALLSIIETSESQKSKVTSELRSKIAQLVSSEGYNDLDKIEKSSAYYDALKSAIANS